MPNKLQRPCSYPGCDKLTRDDRCDDHPHQAAYVPRRDPKRQKLYGRAWQKVRALQLALQPWCEDCLERGIYIPATDVHHEQRHKGDMVKFISSPLRSLCHSCHSIRTAEEVRSERKHTPEKSFSSGSV